MRKKYLDNMRWMTLVMVVFYHVLYMYNAEGIYGGLGKITNLNVQIYDLILYVLYPVPMGILFLVAGMSSKYYLDKHSESSFIKARTIKLLVPSTIAVLCFWFIQGYLNMVIVGNVGDLQGLSAFERYILLVLNGIGVLWFLHVLWLYSMLLIIVRKIERFKLWELCKKANVIVLVLLTFVIFAFAQICNSSMLPNYKMGLYFAYYFIGYFVFSHEEVLEKIKKNYILFIIVAVISDVIFCVKYWGTDLFLAGLNTTLLYNICAWFISLAFFGIMLRIGDFETPLTVWISKRSYGLYIFHYLFISLIAVFLGMPGKVPAVVVYILSFIGGFGGGFLMDIVVSKIPVLRLIFLGIVAKKK
ncbi:MAG: acyltransferase [Lachnospiraceae bacterium]|nr:acyltransferase [Lachnospiraceae bacterium]